LAQNDMSIVAPLELLTSPLTHRRVTRMTDHRPWPMPQGAWIMGQTWTDLLFAHWRVAPSVLERVMPKELPLDTFDGSAWLGVTPFAVRNLRPRLTLPVPVLSSFPELNVRTYVTVGGRPGIYFFSLDAGSPLAVVAARRFYRLPYFRARMTIERTEGAVNYSSERSDSADGPAAAFRGSYRPVGPTSRAVPGSREHWLTERYCLYTLDESRRVLRGEIHHPPWPLQHAEATLEENSMAAGLGIPLDGQPLLHYAHRQDVVFWSLQPAAA
jgi:uncharacterized protein YqjF (DUF2071 family)